ncbi:cyclase [Halopolyspora algeriensis]|uniref:Cyclase n=1 Tax=Halopolyspora algeriensis TaxID=1500506 RepID=A0A368VWF9_9ACTN|nr:MBL fold metallo-hydrolase [Halopolyspora algeriensis]RCW44507.1 cyclase [Halopolyspora algeriensis]TQM55867.1 cyclase [Halopolyspora algeriensis]
MPAEPVVQSLTANVTAYLQLPGGWFLNNAGWITGPDRTLLVDTCATEARSRRLLKAAGPTGNPISAVLTHAHGDHAHGAGLVAAAGGSVMASAAAAAEITTGPHTHPGVFECSTWGDIAPPEHIDTITAPTHIDLGGPSAEILPVPTRAHTDGDLVVWLPREGILFTGDLVFADVTPLALHGSITGWLETLDWLAGFEATTLVPGHGPLDPHGRSLPAVRAYLQWLLDAVDGTDHPDFDALETRARALWSDWHEPERHAANLRVAHAETHRYPPDVAVAAQAMLQSAGGPIPLAL